MENISYDSADVFIFNPAYILKNDITRIVITNEKGKFYTDILEDIETNDGFLNFIHPLHAILLSFFDGNNAYGDIVTNSIELFELPENEIIDIINRFILNNEELSIVFNNFIFSFPKNILIPYSSKYSKRNFDFNSYKINFNDQSYSSIRLNRPIDTVLMINNQCVTDCIYCYADKQNSTSCKISFSRLKEIILEAKELGMRNFDINGGELFLYERWYDLLKLLYENDFEPYISTKVPLKRDDIKKLKELNIKGIQISIDSIDEKELLLNLNRNTKYKESIISTLYLLEEYEIPFYTNTVITRFNSNIVSISNLVSFLVQFKYIRRIGLTAAGYSLYKSEADFQNYKASIKDLDAINAYIEDIKLKHLDIKIFMGSHLIKADIISDIVDTKVKEQKFKNRASCTGNIENFYILPDGKVTICEELYWNPKFLIGDLMKNSILEVWHSSQAQYIYNLNQEHISENSACRNCEEFKNCRTYPGVCWKMVLYAYGEDNWDFPDPRCFKANAPEKVFYM